VTTIPSTKTQRQLIAIGCSSLGISAEMRHEMLEQRFGQGKDSSTKISKIQAENFLRELVSRGFKIKRRRPAPGGSRSGPATARAKNVVKMASPAQREKIHVLAGLIQWRVKDGLTRWLEKRFTLDRIRTAQQAYKVIEGLKKMFENQMRAAYGDDWAQQVYDDPEITRYIGEHLK